MTSAKRIRSDRSESGAASAGTQRQFTDRFATILADVGFPRMPARVLSAATCADRDTITAGELAGELGASPAAISGALRYLVGVNMLEPEIVPGSRSQHYRVPENSWYQSLTHRQELLTRIAAAAEEGAAALPEGSAGSHRLAELVDFITFLDAQLDGLIDRWRVERDQRRAEDRSGRS